MSAVVEMVSSGGVPAAPPQQNCSMKVEYEERDMSSSPDFIHGRMSRGDMGESVDSGEGEGEGDSGGGSTTTLERPAAGESAGVAIKLLTEESDEVDEEWPLPRAGRVVPGPASGDATLL
jgi:hypothetical protein